MCIDATSCLQASRIIDNLASPKQSTICEESADLANDALPICVSIEAASFKMQKEKLTVLVMSMICCMAGVVAQGSGKPDACQQGAKHASQAAAHCWLERDPRHSNDCAQPGAGSWPAVSAVVQM